MKMASAFLVVACLLPANVAIAVDPYDFRKSDAYSKLSKQDRDRLEQVHRDLTMLWGAVDRYTDHHSGNQPDTLNQLVPNYLSELPKDPFATDETANQEIKDSIKSKVGWGYRYCKGSPRTRAWVLSSVGLHDFPYSAAHGNIGLYVGKGVWPSAIYPVVRAVWPTENKPAVMLPQGQPLAAAMQAKRHWGPEQATGAPDTMQAGDIVTAWASLMPDAGLEWLLVEYERPVEVAEVRIRETFNPGAVSKVVAVVDKGQERVLWEGQDPTNSAPTDFVVKPKDRVTSNRIKIYLDTTRKPGWNEIDAVELVGADRTRQWATKATASSTFAEQRRDPRLGMTYSGVGQPVYQEFIGRPVRVHFHGGSTSDGVLRSVTDPQFFLLHELHGRAAFLVNKAQVLYIEIPNALPEKAHRHAGDSRSGMRSSTESDVRSGAYSRIMEQDEPDPPLRNRCRRHDRL